MIKKALILFSLCAICLWGEEPQVLYLTWRGDPSTTMTVMWHTDDGQDTSIIQYQREGEATWHHAEGRAKPLLKSSVTVHQVELTGLNENTDYFFRISDGEIHRFRTLPNGLNRPLKVVIGGDAYMTPEPFTKMNKEVASKDPDFVILTGDIAYSEGLRCALKTLRWKIERWEEFFRIWTRDMVTKEGRIIPIVPVIGNHDVLEGFDDPFKKEVLFYEVFTFPHEGIPFRLMRIGKDLCFYLLDSGHTFPVAGSQAEWLEKSLVGNQQALFHIPAYHMAAYPTVTAFSHRSSRDIRKFWCPLFERYGVKISMEHDNHAFKRTFPIREEKVTPGGVIYLGDGAWGVPPEKPHRHWYLYKSAQINSYWLLTIDRERCLCEAYNNDGELLDKLEVLPHHKAPL
ncbi:MAG: hypothetical protein KR126chlam1_00013 [Chlamydiae bacterium]|nr:hypothetical protein [Chlamydiota bacterium]